MAIKVKGNDIKVTKGKAPLRTIMLGDICIYGENLVTYKINYPATPQGVGFTVKINNKIALSNPDTGGVLGVAENDVVEIRVYGLAHYLNPVSSVVTSTEKINGDSFAIRLNDNVEIERATSYRFVVKSNSTLSISEAEIAPKVNIQIAKDEGVNYIEFAFQNSPYELAFDTDKTFVPTTVSKTCSSDYAEVYYGSTVVESDIQIVCNEGYKAGVSSVSHIEAITNEDQCVISASSIKGKVISLICPSLSQGVKSYSISMVKSDYSRNGSTASFYDGSNFCRTINSRSSYNQQYYIYQDDVIRITAERNEGYKYPTLGTNGNVKEKAHSIDIVLSGDTNIIVDSGEKGTQVYLENYALYTGEYVYMDVHSEYADDSRMVREPVIYVGDTICIPLHPRYRVGTINNRKPGVGLSNGSNTLVKVTFTSTIEHVVQTTTLKVVLVQGEYRTYTTGFGPQLLLTMSDAGTNSTKQCGQTGIASQLCLDDNYGPENFFIGSVSLVFYTKRYVGDAVSTKFYKHEYTNLPNSFSYSCTDKDGLNHSNVLAGHYNISDDSTAITVTLDEYEKRWVANTLRRVYFYAQGIYI